MTFCFRRVPRPRPVVVVGLGITDDRGVLEVDEMPVSLLLRSVVVGDDASVTEVIEDDGVWSVVGVAAAEISLPEVIDGGGGVPSPE